MDKGIIIGAEHEAATRSNLPFVMFRHATSVSSSTGVLQGQTDRCAMSFSQSHLFLHYILLFHLEARQVKEAVLFASQYQDLVFFAHALEILLHTVVESEATLDSESDSYEAETSTDAVLPTVVEFLDHFNAALDVVVGCARKTEMTRWRRLFNIVGNPKALFEVSYTFNSLDLHSRSSFRLVLHPSVSKLPDHIF